MIYGLTWWTFRNLNFLQSVIFNPVWITIIKTVIHLYYLSISAYIINCNCKLNISFEIIIYTYDKFWHNLYMVFIFFYFKYSASLIHLIVCPYIFSIYSLSFVTNYTTALFLSRINNELRLVQYLIESYNLFWISKPRLLNVFLFLKKYFLWYKPKKTNKKNV